MTIAAFEKQNCSIARTFAFLGERWTVLVLRELFLGRYRFDQIQRRLGVATNILSERLATLAEEGIVERRPYSDRPRRFEYRLTEKGLELQPILLALMRWGNHHKGPDGPPLLVIHDECDHETEAVQVCSHCGGELHTGNVRTKPGPGATAEDRPASSASRG
jgi:DNA-binding HxlR family transcriptional regulator